MEKKVVTIPAISCGHCVATVEREVGEVAGVSLVKASLENKQALIEWDAPATWEQIAGLLQEIDYPAQELLMP